MIEKIVAIFDTISYFRCKYEQGIDFGRKRVKQEYYDSKSKNECDEK